MIDYAEQMAQEVGGLFYFEMHALLEMAADLYPRLSGLLEGHLRLRHVLLALPGPGRQGGMVAQFILPKKNEKEVDLRHDSHPIAMGPTVTAVLARLSSDKIVFPDVDPTIGRIRCPAPFCTSVHSCLALVYRCPSWNSSTGLSYFRQYSIRQQHRCRDRWGASK